MADTLSGLIARVFKRDAAINAWPVAILGQTSSGVPIPLTLGGDGTISASSTPQSVTPHFVLLSASSQVIPIDAKGWTVSILTGTGSIGGVAVPAGVSDSDTNTLFATVTIVADAASTAYVRWNT